MLKAERLNMLNETRYVNETKRYETKTKRNENETKNNV